jgi:rhamnosyltransferase
MIKFNQIDAVAGIVVLYEPTREVLRNIQSYIEQVKQLFIVDNSENADYLLVEKIKKINNAEYIGLNENIGIAAALNIGAKRAIEGGYEYLLTMDQDSYATSNFVKKLIEIHCNYKSVGIAAPYPQNRIHKISPPDNSIHQIDKVITSGALLNLRAYIEVGPFMEELFIDYVDFEYCFRLQRNNYSIYINNDAIISHSVGNLIKWKLIGFKFYSTNHSPLRLYYRTRNRFRLRSLYKKYYPSFFSSDMINLLKELLKVILVESNKMGKLKMTGLGYLHYKQNKFGSLNDIRKY